jgi:predicted metal-dependent TIM-barrel fold hydrolase
MDDEVRRRALGAELVVVEAVAVILEGVGEVECLGELGLEEATGAEARLHHQQPRWALGVAG